MTEKVANRSKYRRYLSGKKGVDIFDRYFLTRLNDEFVTDFRYHSLKTL